MGAKISDYKNLIYSRDYSKDFTFRFPQTEYVKRIVSAAVPFLSIIPAARKPLSIAMGAVRVWNTRDVFGLTINVISVAASVFQHRIGMVVTTGYETYLDICNLRNCQNKQEALKGLIKVLNNLVYLALITRGGLELSILASALQMTTNLIQFEDDFGKDRWIEGLANLGMAAYRLHQCETQYEQYKRNQEIAEAVKRIFVGELHEKWKFPSDHLPVGIEVNGIKIISWNVLNNTYMEWVTDKDSQGLNGSLISELNVPINESGLTRRDVYVAHIVQELMVRGDVVPLQECSQPFLQHLENQLPSNWKMAKSFDSGRDDQDVILYKGDELSCYSETTLQAYPSVPGRPLQNAYFSSQLGGKPLLRVINSHIPGDPTKPGKEEFARYVFQQHKNDASDQYSGIATIALGDNNFERDEMMEAYRKAGFSDFSLHSPWKTNIDPVTKESKAIDHVFVKEHKQPFLIKVHSRDLRVEEVLTGAHLKETIDLLNAAR